MKSLFIIDIGNTAVVCARRAEDGTFTALRDCSPRPGEAVAISSVVPQKNEEIVEKVGGKPFIVSSKVAMPFSINIPAPETLGADRIANTAAANALYGAPALVIDIGTATTYDTIDAAGNFFSGAIAPGPVMLARALNEQTALLPFVEWWKNDVEARPFDTQSAITWGLDTFFRGAIKEAAARCGAMFEEKPKIILTGGFAKRFADVIPGIIVDRELTLKGIAALYDYNN